MKNKINPVLKWAGGKRQIKSQIVSEIMTTWDSSKTYFEPFLGGGAIFFELLPEKAYLNDLNEEIINVYEVIKSNPYKLLAEIQNHKDKDCDEYYYAVRELDRKKSYKVIKDYQKAARTIYLNKTCYNGLYRVNSKGQFNTPRGKYNNPKIFDKENIIRMSNFFNNHLIVFSHKDYTECVEYAKEGDVIYFDPPYDYEVENNGFTNYTIQGFNRTDLSRLKDLCDELIDRGCNVYISNNKTNYVTKLFRSDADKIYEYKTITISANRNINSKGSKRKKVDEVLIHGKKNISSSK